LTFSEVMTMAHDSNIKIQWDKISGNPYFRYKTGAKEHTAWFLDGVTLYNQVKIAMNNNAKGFALWRLGAEDPTIWKVLKNPIEVQNNHDALHKIASLDEVNYSGQGEILQIENERKNGLRDYKVDKNGYLTDEVYQSLPSAYEVQRYGKPKGKQVVLTFDDGPDPKYTPEILDILKENKIKAAFFILGENAQLNASIVKRIYDEGHEIGNHTFKHPNVANTSLLRTKVELNTTQRLIQEITGHST
ncbi:polysaccharide deacetylase family protein, partial [Bacillus paramycoides]|uniref:polysaccharide deacetylase family protein n=1 Tax=Bacillus paramycoides TaxID=2026194 RepID=UPI0011A60A86